MAQSKPKHQDYWYLVLATSSIVIGPVLLMFRADGASYWEKWIYITLFIPLGFLVIFLNYTREITLALSNENEEVQKLLLLKIKTKYLRYLLFYIPVVLGYAGLCMWILWKGGL